MSFPEDDGPAANPIRGCRFLLPLLFFGAIGAAVWYWGAGLMRLGSAQARKDAPPAEEEGTLIITRESGR